MRQVSAILLYLIFFSSIFSFIGSGLLNPYRVVLFFSIIVFPSFILKKGYSSFKFEFFFFIFLEFSGLIAMIANSSFSNSINELVYFVFYILLFILFIYSTSFSMVPARYISNLWYFSFIITLPIALVEIVYDIHLPISNEDESSTLIYAGEEVIRRFASVTFGNLNSYNTFLGFSLPFMILGLFYTRSKLEQYLKGIIFFIFIIITVVNASRASYIALVIALVVIFITYIKNNKKNKSMSIALLVFLISIFLNFGSVIFLRFLDSGVKDVNRELLIVNSISSIIEKPFGVGPGNFKDTMGNKFFLDLTSPHNLFLELGVQYGLPVLMLFFIFPFVYYFRLRKINSKFIRSTIIISIVIFPLVAVIDSGYINSPYFILFIASLSSLSVFSRSEYITKISKIM